MKLGFQSAILAELSMEEVIDFASENNFECVELMCWPKGQADRKYAGVTHLDVVGFTQEDAQSILSFCKRKSVEISALGYYPNPLTPDLDEAQIYCDHIKNVISAAALLDIKIVTTFIGNDWTKTPDENWPRFEQVWGPLLDFAEDLDVRIAIENCAMFFTNDEWPAGKNLAYSPAIWRRMFKSFNSSHFGLNYDPSHNVWMQMDYIKPLKEFLPRIFHAHAKDISIDRDRLDDVGTMANPLEYFTPRIPGRGDIDWPLYMQELKNVGYNGALCIEIEDSNYEDSLDDRKRALIESGNYLRQYL